MTQQTPRAHKRYEIRLAAEITLPGGKIIDGVTRDLSLGGGCIACSHPLPEGAEIGLSLFVVVDGIEEATIPPLKVAASIQWAADTEEPDLQERHVAGIRFIGLTGQQGQWLSRFFDA